MAKTANPRPNVWAKDYAPYGTYAGERGSPEQWREAFHFAFNKDTAAECLRGDEPLVVLGLLPGATAEAIKSAFRKLAVRLHPDHGGDPEEFKKVYAAHYSLTH